MGEGRLALDGLGELEEGLARQPDEREVAEASDLEGEGQRLLRQATLCSFQHPGGVFDQAGMGAEDVLVGTLALEGFVLGLRLAKLSARVLGREGVLERKLDLLQARDEGPGGDVLGGLERAGDCEGHGGAEAVYLVEGGLGVGVDLAAAALEEHGDHRTG